MTTAIITMDNLHEITDLPTGYSEDLNRFSSRNAEKYRQEEIQNIINELIQLQSVYADDMVKSVKRKSEELQKARHAYLKAISNVGYDYKAVVNTNELIQR